MKEKLENATQTIEELKNQLKEAQDRVILITGAIQGAELILKDFQSEAEQEVEVIPKKVKK